MSPTIILIAASVLCSILIIALIVQHRRRSQAEQAAATATEMLAALQARFQGVVDADAEAARVTAAAAARVQEAEGAEQESKRRREEADRGFEDAKVAYRWKLKELDQKYQEAKTLHDRLKAEVTLLEENLSDISYGLYKPHYDFATTELFKQRLEEIRQRQKLAVRGGTATHCAVEWSIGGSRREGERMQKQYTKVLLRAFNAECDAAVAKVTWNNMVKMEERIAKAFQAINELGGVMQITITPAYLDLKLEELRLEFEQEEKRRRDQDEQRQIREQIRDAEKAQRDAERAEKEAQAEQTRVEAALERARREVARATGEEQQRLSDRVLTLEAELEAARKLRERAIALAQVTKAGYVYIISNVGSFGDGVFKIGMTRRLDPMDRVRELGDASVPFSFDVHAMVYCEDAPAMENAFHKAFADRSINLVNLRKEFFRVSLDEVEAFASAQNLKMELTHLAEAREYRQSLAMRVAAEGAPPAPAPDFPTSLNMEE